ncbi:MAG: DUF6817 domain-containing protein [Halioglobus sp.]
MNEKFQKLSELGAGEFSHLDGTLIEHLIGTHDILIKWNASTALADAGLYHAAYGTAGFDERLVSIDQRGEIADIIGAAAEEIVFQYCACSRQDFYAQIGTEQNPRFKNRFSGESYYLSQEMLISFCELTAANEIEIALDNPSFVNEHGKNLNNLCKNMAPYLSAAARTMAADIFAAPASPS